MAALPLTRALLGLLGLACAACGPGSYVEFRAQLVDASCHWAKRCGYVGASDRAACPIEDLLASFHDSALDRSMPGAIDVAASIEAGRMRYDSVHAQECLDAISGAPCDDVHARRTRELACNAVVGANTETDSPCWTDIECTGGICVHQPGCAGSCGNYASPGAPCVDSEDAVLAMRCDPTVGYCGPANIGDPPTCQRKKGEGQACLENRECLFGWTCRTGTCVEPIEVGEGEACGGIDPCGDGLYCEPSTLRCATQHKRTEPCSSRVGCDDGLACLGLVAVDPMGVPTAAQTAGVCGDWLDVGMACTSRGGDPEPSITGCPSLSQRCDRGVCASHLTVAGPGDSCASAACDKGLACNALSRCDFTRAIFGDCRRDRAPLCELGLVCAGADLGPGGGTCMPPDALACFVPVAS